MRLGDDVDDGWLDWATPQSLLGLQPAHTSTLASLRQTKLYSLLARLIKNSIEFYYSHNMLCTPCIVHLTLASLSVTFSDRILTLIFPVFSNRREGGRVWQLLLMWNWKLQYHQSALHFITMIIIIHLTIISIISTVWAQADQDYCKFSPKHTMCQYKVEFDTITINIIIDIPPYNLGNT